MSAPFLARLRQIVGDENCLAREGELFAYECDGLTLSPKRPLAVVLPETTAQVAAIGTASTTPTKPSSLPPATTANSAPVSESPTR